MFNKKKLHLDPLEFQMSPYPNILERVGVGAKMAVSAAECNFLCIKENIRMGNLF